MTTTHTALSAEHTDPVLTDPTYCDPLLAILEPGTPSVVTPATPTVTLATNAAVIEHMASIFAEDAVTGRKTNEVTTLHAAIKATVSSLGDGWLDSHAVADAVWNYREANGINRCRTRDASWTQAKDYVQHVLRDNPHGCNHAHEGGIYRLHLAEVCSEECKKLPTPGRTPKAVVARYGRCDCGMTLPASGCCDYC